MIQLITVCNRLYNSSAALDAMKKSNKLYHVNNNTNYCLNNNKFLKTLYQTYIR